MEINIPPALAIFGMIVALACVFWSADKVLLNAVALSRRLHLTPFIIGAIVIGFGTSAPEISTSVFAALNHKLPLAVGATLGSNIANILLVLGVAAFFTGFTPSRMDLKQKSWILLLATILPGLLLLDNYHLSRSDAVILLLGFVLCLYCLCYLQKPDAPTNQEKVSPSLSTWRVELWLLISLIALIIASQAVVSCAIITARYFGVSELIIGLTIIAIGTSLPELSTTLASIRHKHPSVALGNIFGSNIFNALAATGIAVMISPETIPGEVLTRDYLVMVGATLLLFLLLFVVPPRMSLGRVKSLLLLTSFIIYQITLYFQIIG